MQTKVFQVVNLILLVLIGVTFAIAAYAYNGDINDLKKSDIDIIKILDKEITNRKESDEKLKDDLEKKVDAKVDISAFDILLKRWDNMERKLDDFIISNKD